MKVFHPILVWVCPDAPGSLTRRWRMRRTQFLAALALSTPLVLAGGCSGAGASPLPVFSAPVILNVGSVEPSHQFNLGDVSCVAPGSCTAVGTTYNASFSFSTPVEITEIRGVWGDAHPVPMPAGVDYHEVEQNQLFEVQCFSVGNCVAVGQYVGTNDIGMPMATSEIDGVWQQAVPIALPADAISQADNATGQYPAWLSGLSCQSMNTCTSVGTYPKTDGTGLMVVNESDGLWQTATEIAMATDYQMEADSWSISCSSTINCTIGGPALNPASGYFASAATESGGIWDSASPITMTPASDIDAISCRSATTCVAVGYKGAGSHAEPLIYDESNGAWGESVVTVPQPKGFAALLSVSCVSVGNCYVVGDATNEGHGFVVVDSDGKWLKPIALPTSGPINANLAGANSVSCVSSDSCTILGWRYLPGKAAGSIVWTAR